MKKKVMALLMTSVMTLSLGNSALAAELAQKEAQTENMQVTYTEMNYAKAELNQNDVVYYTTVEDAAKALRKGWVERQQLIKIGFASKDGYATDRMNDILKEAYAHTGNPVEGDYLRGQYNKPKMSYEPGSNRYKSGTYYITLCYEFDHMTTAQQEAELGQAVNRVLESFHLETLSDYEKAEKIYNYICENVKYDYTNLNNPNYTRKYTAYAAMMDKTAVCQGYSMLFYRMALASGLDARFVTNASMDHGWCIVKVDGLYYLLDATWDSELTNHKYFLMGSNDFAKHDNCGDEFEDPAFAASYPLAQNKYVPEKSDDSEIAPYTVDEEDEGEDEPQGREARMTSFEDVEDNAYYTIPVNWAVFANITSGTSPTTFAPNDICTRAQVVTFLWRKMGSPEPKSLKNPFYDVKSTDYFFKPVLWAAEKGITNGTDAHSFSPNAGCTRGQVVTFLWRAEGNKITYNSTSFTDVNYKDYFYNAVRWAVKKGITLGVTPTSFDPSASCTRGQIVTFLYRCSVGF